MVVFTPALTDIIQVFLFYLYSFFKSVQNITGVLVPHKWENAMTVDKPSWGYRRTAKISEILTPHELITTLVETVSCGGNLLVNVGPTKEGTIIPIFQERLMQLGTWLSINGDSIYESNPWTVQNDTSASPVWYTSKNETVYAIFLQWPSENFISLEHPDIVSYFTQKNPTVTLLGNEDKILAVNGYICYLVSFNNYLILE